MTETQAFVTHYTTLDTYLITWWTLRCERSTAQAYFVFLLSLFLLRMFYEQSRLEYYLL